MSDGTPTATPTADLGPRILAALIDAVLAFAVGFVPVVGGLAAAAYWVVRDGLDVEFMDHRSLGKKVMNLRPVTAAGAPVDLQTSVKRNWMLGLGGVAQILLFIPFVGWLLVLPVALAALVVGVMELILVLTSGRRWGDRLAGTRVVEARPAAARPAAAAGPTAAAGLVLLTLLAGCGGERDGADAALAGSAATDAPAAERESVEGRPGSSEAGSFQVTFSGRREGTMSGEARFYPMSLGFGGPIPRIVLYDVRGPEDYFYIHLQPSIGWDLPGEGTYPASAFQQEGFMIAVMEMQGMDLWILAGAAEGTVTVTEASDRRMAGRFVLREPAEGGATLEGTFDATSSSEDEVPEPVR